MNFAYLASFQLNICRIRYDYIQSFFLSSLCSAAKSKHRHRVLFSVSVSTVVLNDGFVILPSKYARNIGVMFYSVLNFERRITGICKSIVFIVLKKFCLLSTRRF